MEGVVPDDRLPIDTLFHATSVASSVLPHAHTAVDGKEVLEGHMQAVEACIKQAQQRLLCADDKNISQMYDAAHAVVLAMPDSECIKDLERNVRNVVVCYVLCIVGYTSRNRFEDKICSILEVASCDKLNERYGMNTMSQVCNAYQILVGGLPGAFPSKFKASKRPPRKEKRKGSTTEGVEAQTIPTQCGATTDIPQAVPNAKGNVFGSESSEDTVVVKTVCALASALTELPSERSDLIFKIMGEMQESSSACVFGVRVQEFRQGDAGRSPTAIFSTDATPCIPNALRTACLTAQCVDSKKTGRRLAAQVLSLPQIMDLFAFDRVAIGDVLGIAYDALEGCLQAFVGAEDWISSSSHTDRTKDWSWKVLHELAKQRVFMTAESSPPPHVLWGWLLDEAQSRLANSLDFDAKHFMQRASMLILILFGNERQFLLHAVVNMDSRHVSLPWEDQLCTKAFHAIDCMLSDLIYAELISMDCDALACYALGQGWYQVYGGHWKSGLPSSMYFQYWRSGPPSCMTIYMLAAILRSMGTELSRKPQLQQQALDYMLHAAYAEEQNYDYFTPEGMKTIGAVLWAIKQVFVPLGSVQVKNWCEVFKLAKKVQKDLAWANWFTEPFMVNGLGIADELCLLSPPMREGAE